MGLKAVTDGKAVTVYRKDRQTQNGGTFATYSLGISSKDKDGNWQNGYIECLFKKGVELANKAKIEISNSFFTVSEYNGKKTNKLFIMEFTVVDNGEVRTQPPQVDNSFLDAPDGFDEVPFE